VELRKVVSLVLITVLITQLLAGIDSLSAKEGKYDSITDVPGIKVGSVTDLNALTGVTVILAEPAATAGVDVRGSAPGTRETDLLNPINLVQEVNAVVLAGGSAFGLDAATGVMRYLEKRGIGFKTAAGVVPIVPAAVLYDLEVGDPKVRPDAEMGYEACLRATSGKIKEGNVGAGTGAVVHGFGGGWLIKGGLGTASVELDNGIIVGAIVAVNAAGSVVNENGEFYYKMQGVYGYGDGDVDVDVYIDKTQLVVECDGRISIIET
jgi:L-aminopeptidase/D-esterase